MSGKLCPTWAEAPLSHRLRECRRMLYLHGFLTDKESASVEFRINQNHPQRPASPAARAATEGGERDL